MDVNAGHQASAALPCGTHCGPKSLLKLLENTKILGVCNESSRELSVIHFIAWSS